MKRSLAKRRATVARHKQALRAQQAARQDIEQRAEINRVFRLTPIAGAVRRYMRKR